MLAGEELSDQVIDAFREMPEQQALQVLNTFKSSNLNTINNRSAFLLGLIKQSYKGSTTFNLSISLKLNLFLH